MLYREIMAVCSEIHTKHINTLCGQNVELLNVKLAVHIVTTGLRGVILIYFILYFCLTVHNICFHRFPRLLQVKGPYKLYYHRIPKLPAIFPCLFLT